MSGYLPQDIELFADNRRREYQPISERVVAKLVVKAAQLAGVHEMICRLPDGYETQVGGGGTVLSAATAQRIGLAARGVWQPRLWCSTSRARIWTPTRAALAECVVKLRKRA